MIDKDITLEDVFLFCLFIQQKEWVTRVAEKAELISNNEFDNKFSLQINFHEDLNKKFHKMISDYKTDIPTVTNYINQLQSKITEFTEKYFIPNKLMNVTLPLYIMLKDPLIDFNIKCFVHKIGGQ